MVQKCPVDSATGGPAWHDFALSPRAPVRPHGRAPVLRPACADPTCASAPGPPTLRPPADRPTTTPPRRPPPRRPPQTDSAAASTTVAATDRDTTTRGGARSTCLIGQQHARRSDAHRAARPDAGSRTTDRSEAVQRPTGLVPRPGSNGAASRRDHRRWRGGETKLYWTVLRVSPTKPAAMRPSEVVSLGPGRRTRTAARAPAAAEGAPACARRGRRPARRGRPRPRSR